MGTDSDRCEDADGREQPAEMPRDFGQRLGDTAQHDAEADDGQATGVDAGCLAVFVLEQPPQLGRLGFQHLLKLGEGLRPVLRLVVEVAGNVVETGLYDGDVLAQSLDALVDGRALLGLRTDGERGRFALETRPPHEQIMPCHLYVAATATASH
jgi:hypothetical protein